MRLPANFRYGPSRAKDSRQLYRRKVNCHVHYRAKEMCASGLPVHRSRRQRVLQPAMRRRRSRGRDLVRLRTSGLRAYRVARCSWKLTPLHFPKVRSCKKIGWQAEASAPQKHKPLRANVGQTLSSVRMGLRPAKPHEKARLVGQAILPADSLSASPAACKAACFFGPVNPAIAAMFLQLPTQAA
jgi:hypothetical protein